MAREIQTRMMMMKMMNVPLVLIILMIITPLTVHSDTTTTTTSLSVITHTASARQVGMYNYTFSLFTTHGSVEIRRVEYFNGSAGRHSLAFHSVAKISELSDFASVRCGDRVFDRYSDGVTPTMLLGDTSGFVLPCLYPHNQLPLARYPSAYCDTPIQRERRHLLVMVIVKYAHHISDHTSCVLHLKHPSEQFAWPIVRLYNSTDDHVVGDIPLDAINSTPLIDDENNDSTDDAAAGGVVQAIPTRSLYIDANIWGTHPNNHAADDSDDDDAGYSRPNSIVTSFVEVESMVTILGAAMDAVIRPIMKEALGRVCRDIQHRMTQEVTNAAMERVPEQVIELITVPMKYNITNGVLDAGAFRIIDTLTKSFTNELGPTIADKIATTLVPQLHEQITPILTHAVADDIMHMLPQLMKRSLKLVMTPRLMRTCTHSIVASVDMALGHTADPEENSYCRRCYNDGNSCMKCKTSRSYKYYQHYYATYYAEYFSEFYLQYYADALLILDEFYNPDGFVSKLPAGFALKA